MREKCSSMRVCVTFAWNACVSRAMRESWEHWLTIRELPHGRPRIATRLLSENLHGVSAEKGKFSVSRNVYGTKYYWRWNVWLLITTYICLYYAITVYLLFLMQFRTNITFCTVGVSMYIFVLYTVQLVFILVLWCVVVYCVYVHCM